MIYLKYLQQVDKKTPENIIEKKLHIMALSDEDGK